MMLIIFCLILVPILTACYSTPETVEQQYFLNPDPAPPAFNNTMEIRDLIEDITALKILVARWKIKSYSDRNIIGELSDEELKILSQPLIDAVEKFDSENGDN